MGVERFSDADAARRALLTGRPRARLEQRIRSLWARAGRWAPRSGSSGVKRFRDVDEAKRDRDLETARRVDRLRARRHD